MKKKTTHILLLSFAVLVVLVGLPCIAQNPADQPASQAAGASQAATQPAISDPAVRAKVQEKLQHLSSELNLTEDQKTKIKSILENEFGQVKTIRDNTTLSADQKQAQMKEVHASAKTQINGLLTPDQQRKLAAMKEEKSE